MARIYKCSDRIPIRIDDIVIKISPLTADQKSEIQALMIQGRLKGDIKAASRGTALAIKYGVKDVSGIEDGSGVPYKLSFEGGVLTDECVDDLLNLDCVEKMTFVCISLLKKIPKEFTDHEGKVLEGVEFVSQESEPKNG